VGFFRKRRIDLLGSNFGEESHMPVTVSTTIPLLVELYFTLLNSAQLQLLRKDD